MLDFRRWLTEMIGKISQQEEEVDRTDPQVLYPYDRAAYPEPGNNGGPYIPLDPVEAKEYLQRIKEERPEALAKGASTDLHEVLSGVDSS